MSALNDGSNGHHGAKHALRVAIVNDYEVIVAGVRAMLLPYSHRVNVVEVDVDEDPSHDVDVALFDTYGQPGLGIDRIETLTKSDHVGYVAVYSWTLTDASRTAALKAGANALIAKTVAAEDLVRCLQSVSSGETVETGGFRGATQGAWPGTHWRLTARESETLALLVTGMTNRDIAKGMYVAENTVRSHLKAIFRKLSVTNRSEAIVAALSNPSFTTRNGKGH